MERNWLRVWVFLLLFLIILTAAWVDECDQEITPNPVQQLLGEPVRDVTQTQPSHLKEGAPEPKPVGMTRASGRSWKALSCQSLRVSWEIIQFSNSPVFHSALLCQGNPERHFTVSSCLQLLPLTTFSTGGVAWALAISEAKENFERCRTCCSVL